MLKAVLSFLAVVGLLLSPIHAQAAQADCMAMGAKAKAAVHAMTSMGEMDMSCCDKAMAKSSKTSPKDKACMDNCVTMCGLSSAVASDGSVVLPVLAVEQVSFNAKAAPLFTQEPGLVVPPPKSQA